jgi:hypothetical protein
VGEGASRDRGRALPDDPHPGERPVGEAARDVVGELRRIETRDEVTVALRDPTAQRLAETLRGLVDFLREEVAVLAAIDVARRHLGGENVARTDLDRRAVVAEQLDAGGFTRATRMEDRHLTATRRIVGAGRSLAVHAHVTRRLLDQPVRLARHDEPVLGKTDAQTLTAAAQGKVHLLGLVARSAGDRHRPFERRHRVAERIGDRGSGRHLARHERGDDLCVGGDRLCQPQLVPCPQVGVIVDVTVEGGDEIRRSRRRLEFLAVHGVRIGFGNDADARPPRVPEHGHPGTLATDEQPQQVVGGNGGTHDARVVAEFADLGGRLVHERPCIRRDAHGTGSEQGIVATIGEKRDDARVVVAHAVVPHRHVHARRVASAHFESVECGECLLDGEVRRQCALVRTASGERVHGLGGAQPVHAQCPHRITQ